MASTDPRRGEIWLVSLVAGRKGEPATNRPAIIVSVDDILAGVDDELFIVVPLSSSRAPSRLRPAISPDEGLDSPSAAICRGVRAVTRTRLLQRVGKLKPEMLREVERALATILGIEGAQRV